MSVLVRAQRTHFNRQHEFNFLRNNIICLSFIYEEASHSTKGVFLRIECGNWSTVLLKLSRLPKSVLDKSLLISLKKMPEENNNNFCFFSNFVE